ncbi:Smr domain-containing protein [Mycena kentingensis (nom. inval.)]|nr:Smr domain-containing protein [Mycena kentingensis (nom. inval.)]
MVPLTLILISAALVNAGSQNKGDNCSQTDSRLQTGTFQFWSDCNSVTYCAANNTCVLKGCRKDDFPFGYEKDSHLPDKCDVGQFCPDEADACQPLLAVGSACQLNRDDECEAPPNFKDLRDNTNRGRNFNGSVCLNNVCMWANKTAGETCTVENTAYIAYGVTDEFPDIVSRGDCVVGLYCDSQSKQCIQEKALGEACTADKECGSWNCLSSGTCGVDTSLPNKVGTWVYAVVAVGILGGIFGTLFGLFALHRRQRDTEREKRMQYWREQNAFHQNLLQMRQVSIPGNGGNSARSTMYEDAPIMQHAATKSSGLRNYMNDDGSDYDDGMMMQPTGRRAEPGRF